jgi:hypothetical protein
LKAATEARLCCYSSERQEKEAGISNRFIEKFENGLAKLAAGLTSPRGEKRHDRILQRIGRLQEKSHGIGRHYRIEGKINWGRTTLNQLGSDHVRCMIL